MLFTICAVVATLAFAQAGPTGFGIGAHGAYGGYGATYGGAHGYDLDLGHGYGFNSKMAILSCFETRAVSSSNAIAVNIQPRTYSFSGDGFGAGSLGLKATINVFSQDGADLTIAFTERADALGSGIGGCSGAGYGSFIGPASYGIDDRDDLNHRHGYGFGAFGYGYGYGHGYTSVSPSVARTKLAAGMIASFHIDHLEGFTSLSQLAGRGVIACKDSAVKQDTSTGQWSCTTDASDTALPCCSLHYSGAGDTLGANGVRNGAKVSVANTATFVYDVTGKDLSEDSSDYNSLKAKFEEALLTTLKPTMNGLVGVVITNLRKGSLIVDFDMVIDTDVNQDYNTSVSTAMQVLAENGLVVDGDVQPVELPNGLTLQYDNVNDGGPWLIFQHRISGDVDFRRNWANYTTGFGNTENYWMGLDFVYSYCNVENPCKLRIDLSRENLSKYAEYGTFYLGGPDEKFTIHLAGYSGDAGDSMIVSPKSSNNANGMKFSTADSDNDKNGHDNCAELYEGPWWHNSCMQVTLNGVYGSTKRAIAPTWFTFTNSWEGLTSTAMKLSQIPQ